MSMGQGYEYYFSGHFHKIVKDGATPYLPAEQVNDTVNLMIGQARCLFNCQPVGKA